MGDSRNALMLVAAAGFIAVAATAAVFAYGGEQDRGVQVADGFSWRGSMDSGDVLEIKGVNGPIVVERGTFDADQRRKQEDSMTDDGWRTESDQRFFGSFTVTPP